MIIGYEISAHDDDSYMLGTDTFKPTEKNSFYDWRFGRINEPHPATCPQCGRKTNNKYINDKYKVKKRKREIVCTYDGYLLVSRKIRDKLISIINNELDFIDLPNDNGFFWLNPNSIIEFDVEKRKTRFENFCDKCNSYHDVVGSNPIYLKDSQLLKENRIFKTNIEFGSGHEQHPLIIIGKEIYSCLKEDVITGIEYYKIEE